MKLDVIENEDEKLKIMVHDNLTLVNLVNENIWQQKGIEVSGYSMQHPYLSQPVLIVKSKNPKKSVTDAALQIVDDVKDVRKQFLAQMK